MEVNRCFKCMEEHVGDGACPHCGFDVKSYMPELYQLKPGTILAGKYLLGTVLGEGGFGISYVGWDLNLDCKVAIKEYYPRNYVTRQATYSPTVTALSGNNMENYEKGKRQFVDEARRLAKFDHMPGIVYVRDFFEENGTAYMVMEFAEGKTLKERLKENGEKLPSDIIFAMMEPVMKSLGEIHKQGMIHRDISPDNMMVDKKGKVKLLDFGAARDYLSEEERSLSVILKQGYTPEAQYRSRGEQGPWTDVYALCATIYRAVTGVVPLESLDRMEEDTLRRPSELGAVISPARENAIMKGLSVRAKDRYQNMEELWQACYTGMSQNRQAQNVRMGNTGGQTASGSEKNRKMLPVAAIVLVAVIAFAVFFSTRGKKQGDYDYDVDGDTVTIEEYTGEDGTVKIPSEVEENPVTKIDGTFEGDTELVNVTIPEGVTEIGEDTFKGCTNLSSVTLPGSIEKIGKGAFSGCGKLASVTLPGKISVIEENVFEGCGSLKNIKLPDSIQEIGKGAFKDCTSLETVTFPIGTVTVRTSAFSGCRKIGKISMSAASAALVEVVLSLIGASKGF